MLKLNWFIGVIVMRLASVHTFSPFTSASYSNRKMQKIWARDSKVNLWVTQWLECHSRLYCNGSSSKYTSRIWTLLRNLLKLTFQSRPILAKKPLKMKQINYKMAKIVNKIKTKVTLNCSIFKDKTRLSTEIDRLLSSRSQQIRDSVFPI